MPSQIHELKIKQLKLKDQHLKEEGMRMCRKQFPVFTEKHGPGLIDLACFHERGFHFAHEIETNISSKQAEKNRDDLRKFKSSYEKSRICQHDLVSGKSQCSD